MKATFIHTPDKLHPYNWVIQFMDSTFWLVGDSGSDPKRMSFGSIDLLERTCLSSLYDNVTNDNSHIREV